LRRPDESRVLWVDLIRIDQDNKHEKDPQVTMIATRCSGADNFCIWLVDAEENGDEEVRFVSNELSDIGQYETITNTDNFAKSSMALGAAINRPWFGRRWVF